MRSFEHIAKLIRTKRLEHPQRFSQSQLSLALGYKNGQFISNVERGLCNIPLKILPKICDVLNITPQELKEAILQDQEETLLRYLDRDYQQKHKDDLANKKRLKSVDLDLETPAQ